MTGNDNRWHRQPWFWSLIAVPAGLILGATLMIYMITSRPHDLVADESYRQARQKTATATQPAVVARIAIGREVEVDLDGPAESALRLNLFHASSRSRDQTLTLTPSPDRPRHYRGRLANTPTGRWHIELQGTDTPWRLRGTAFLPADQPLVMRHAPATTD